MHRRLPLVVALCIAAALALAPASRAVVGGEPVAASAVPWFATLPGLCGGTLVAPDRVVTAAHCVEGAPPTELPRVRVGGVVRTVARIAQPPGARDRRNAGTALDDVAILQLDAPVPDVRPVPLALSETPVPARVRVLGRGIANAPGTRRGGSGAGPLREARLRTLTDAGCARRYRRRRGNDGERFRPAEMLCALDVDGRAPLSSGCVGDSGGPVYGGTRTAPVLFGVVSWGGDRCGADRLPTVSAEIARYAGFIADPDPVWAPIPGGPTRVAGAARVGSTLTCEVAPWQTEPERVRVRWVRLRRGRVLTRGTGPTYTVRSSDAGVLLGCLAAGSTAGGSVNVPSGDASFVRVARAAT